jgi:hypothetical protein
MRQWFAESISWIVLILLGVGAFFYFRLQPKSKPPKSSKAIYDVRSNNLGKQYIYKNDSVYIVHILLDSVIKDSVERDDCPCYEQQREEEEEEENSHEDPY